MADRNMIRKYNRLVRTRTVFDDGGLTAHVPTPTDSDYRRGYIVRYFVQRANDPSAPIMEIDETEYSRALELPHYRTARLDWKIKGSSDKIKDANKKSVAIATKQIQSIRLYLPNLIQFGRE